MLNKPNAKDLHPTLYNYYGIYVDWQIDNNLTDDLGTDPHNISSFDDFIQNDCFELAEFEYDGEKYIGIDINLKYFSFLKILGVFKKKILESSLKGKEVYRRLKVRSKEFNLKIFDMFELYMSTCPHDLTDPNIMNSNPKMRVIDLCIRKKDLM